MKRLLTLVVLVCTTATLFAATPASASHRRNHLCRYQSLDGHKGFTDTEVRKTIRCAETKWPVSGGIAMAFCIAKRESGFDEFAKNPYSSASGVFQVVSGTWASWRSTFHDKLARYKALSQTAQSVKEPWKSGTVFHARANVMTSIIAMHRYGLGPWGGGCG